MQFKRWSPKPGPVTVFKWSEEVWAPQARQPTHTLLQGTHAIKASPNGPLPPERRPKAPFRNLVSKLLPDFCPPSQVHPLELLLP